MVSGTLTLNGLNKCLLWFYIFFDDFYDLLCDYRLFLANYVFEKPLNNLFLVLGIVIFFVGLKEVKFAQQLGVFMMHKIILRYQ